MTRKRRGLVAIILAFAIMVSNISITFATSFQTIEAATYVVSAKSMEEEVIVELDIKMTLLNFIIPQIKTLI